MSDESKILSTEEIDTLSKATQENGSDLTEILSSASAVDKKRTLNAKASNNITELTWSECEKRLSSFLRKKIAVKAKSSHLSKLSDALHHKDEIHIFTVFKLLPSNYFAVVVIDLPMLHQATNFLFGGQTHDTDEIIQSPAKIGTMIGEKLSHLCMESFTVACKEYGSVSFETIKTVTLPNLITKLSKEDNVYSIDLSVFFGEIETTVSIIIAADFFYEFIPAGKEDMVVIDNPSWRTSIESQVVDSNVTVCVSLPEISIKASDLVALKCGDLIPIGDPTLVDIYFNDTKLFNGKAGQANSNRVVKILSEI